ncbi:FAD-binding protein [Tunturiibacter gelidiferens]|uniref:FAD-binding protein n=1 Tax=Tunturiibacter gelidiferens TaxID=3069689 RepID=UPI003D9B6533
MIFDLLHESPRVLTADLCIVGAGAAGITLAVESARKGKTVLLLEGGGATREDSSQSLYESEIAGLPHRGIHTGRIRVREAPPSAGEARFSSSTPSTSLPVPAFPKAAGHSISPP